MIDAGRLLLIRRKNVAFDRLYAAVLHCERKRHSSGAVPPAWLRRLEALEAAYAEACAVVENNRR